MTAQSVSVLSHDFDSETQRGNNELSSCQGKDAWVSSSFSLPVPDSKQYCSLIYILNMKPLNYSFGLLIVPSHLAGCLSVSFYNVLLQLYRLADCLSLLPCFRLSSVYLEACLGLPLPNTARRNEQDVVRT